MITNFKLTLCFLALFTSQSLAATLYNFTTCSDTQYFSTTSVACKNCADSTTLAPYGNTCVCKVGYTPTNPRSTNTNVQCTVLSGDSPSSCNKSFVTPLVDITGSQQSTLTCTKCQGSTFPNSNKSLCISCGVNSQPDNDQCRCLYTYHTKGIDGCYDLTSINQISTSTSSYSTLLPKALSGCVNDGDLLSCSFLMNLCLYSQLDMSTSSPCNVLKTYTHPVYKYNYLFMDGFVSDFSATPTLDSTDTTKLSYLKFKMVRYLPTGNVFDQKSMTLGDIIMCPLTQQSIGLKVGNNLRTSCTFNFNNSLQLITATNSSNYMYSMFVADESNNYHIVPVYINGYKTPVSRFFLVDLFSIPYTNKMTVVTKMKIGFKLIDSKLTTPQLSLEYSSLTVSSSSSGSYSLISPLQNLQYELTYSYDLTKFYNVIIPLFIVTCVIALLHACARTYVGFCNKKSVFLFVFYLMQTWSTYIFFFLMLTTGYWFIFSKATQQIYILLPQESGFYTAFYILIALMVVFRIIVQIWEKIDIIKSEVFIIDYESSTNLSGKTENNSWRSMFIINSLAEFYTFRTISFFWMLAWTLFLLVGLGWENHSAEVTDLTLTKIFSVHPHNGILVFFLSSSIMLVVGVVMKFLRRISVIWWPYPFEDFIDFCTLANISLFFCKRSIPFGYYLHATNPDKAEVTFQEINEQIAQGSQSKQRDFLADPIAESKSCQTYLVYMSNNLETKLSAIRRAEESTEPIRFERKDTKPLKAGYRRVNQMTPREQFVQNQLKIELQKVKLERNQIRTRTFTQQFLRLPPIDLNQPQTLSTLVANPDYQHTELFPYSDEFYEMITFTITFALFSLVTGSCAIGGFLAYFLIEILESTLIGNYARSNLEKWTRVKQGFML